MLNLTVEQDIVDITDVHLEVYEKHKTFESRVTAGDQHLPRRGQKVCLVVRGLCNNLLIKWEIEGTWNEAFRALWTHTIEKGTQISPLMWYIFSRPDYHTHEDDQTPQE